MTLNELSIGDTFEVVECNSPKLKEMGFFKWAKGTIINENNNVKMVSINGYKAGVDNFESRSIIVEKK